MINKFINKIDYTDLLILVVSMFIFAPLFSLFIAVITVPYILIAIPILITYCFITIKLINNLLERSDK